MGERTMLIFPLINDTSRKIIHIDMDAFFASVEERDNPLLKESLLLLVLIPEKPAAEGLFLLVIMRLESLEFIQLCLQKKRMNDALKLSLFREITKNIAK